MLDFILFYIAVGFVINLAQSLFLFYKGGEDGYIILPHPMIFFLTIFSWPITLWELVKTFGRKES